MIKRFLIMTSLFLILSSFLFAEWYTVTVSTNHQNYRNGSPLTYQLYSFTSSEAESRARSMTMRNWGNLEERYITSSITRLVNPLFTEYADLSLNSIWFNVYIQTGSLIRQFIVSVPDNIQNPSTTAVERVLDLARNIFTLEQQRMMTAVDISQRPMPPDVPGNLQAAVNGNTLSASWNPVPGVEEYLLFVAANQGSPSVQSVRGTSITFRNLAYDTWYDISIRSKGASDYSRKSFPAVAVRTGSAPAVTPEPEPERPVLTIPGNLRAVPDRLMVTVSWDSVPDITDYRLEYRKKMNPVTAFLSIPVSGWPRTTVNNLEPQFTYEFRVISVRQGEMSEPSGVIEATPLPYMDTPTAPRVTPGLNQLTISWDPVINAASYEVKIGTQRNVYAGTGTVLRPAIAQTQVVFSPATAGRTYYVVVIAKSSGRSDTVSPEVTGVPTAPSRKNFEIKVEIQTTKTTRVVETYIISEYEMDTAKEQAISKAKSQYRKGLAFKVISSKIQLQTTTKPATKLKTTTPTLKK